MCTSIIILCSISGFRDKMHLEGILLFILIFLLVFLPLTVHTDIMPALNFTTH
jgi:hypothetical protein